MRRLVCSLAAISFVLAGVACSGDDGAVDEPVTTTAPSNGQRGADPAEAGPETGPPGFPGAEWTVSDPESHDMDPALLDDAREYAFVDGRETQGVVVVRGGEIVSEWYAEGASEESWAASWSVAKSVLSAVVGIAIEEGYIGSVEDSAADYLTDWAGTDHEAITIENLLHMASGLEWSEAYAGSAETSEIVQMVTGEADQLAFAMAQPLIAEPGTRWSYSSGDSLILAGVVEAAVGRPLGEYAREVLFDPIDMGPVDWWTDVEGNTLGYCCVDTTSRDFARIGLLYLNDGKWGDEQVVPSEWVEASLAPLEPSGGMYGYQWWLDDPEGTPEDHFGASGHDGQSIDVFPELDLVVVRSGTYAKDPGEPVAEPSLFAKYPPGGYVPGKGTVPPGDWTDASLLAPIVAAAGDN